MSEPSERSGRGRSAVKPTPPSHPLPLLFSCGGCGERSPALHALEARLRAAGAVESASPAALMAEGSARGAALREAVRGGRLCIALDGCDQDCALRCLRQCLAGDAAEAGTSVLGFRAGAADPDAVAMSHRIGLLAGWLGD